ncbi:MAG: HAMP domain-containing protein [Deltaproteobacteria bacterium]|nr:HAMP domain-containing protein [Deltaproteobacteria bacterium]MCB9786781.1 HAMP domain-containing protein [Deltaproteobacteria bacterium]
MIEWLTDRWRNRRAGVRTRLALMLVGVLLLVVTQTVLAVSYTRDLFTQSEQVKHLASASEALDDIRAHVYQALDEHGSATTEEQLERLARSAAEARDAAARVPRMQDRLETLAERLDAHGALLLDSRRDRESVTPPLPLVSRLLAWREAVSEESLHWLERHPDANLSETTEELIRLREQIDRTPDLLIGPALSEHIWVGAGVGAARRAMSDVVAESAAKVRFELASSRHDVSSAYSAASALIGNTVESADRYLITLVLLTLVYIVVLVFIVPERLVAPLRHLASVVHRVSLGHYEVRAHTEHRDEFGAFGESLNHMLDQVLAFDELKRERVYQDRTRIVRLADLIADPVALIDTRLRLSLANRSFRKLFALADGYEDTDIRDRLDSGEGGELGRALEAALRRHRPVRRLPVTVNGRLGTHDLALTIEPGRDSAGRIAYLLLRFEPRESA